MTIYSLDILLFPIWNQSVAPCPVLTFASRDQGSCVQISQDAGQEATVEQDMEQQTGSKWEKEYVKAVYCHLDYLTYNQSTSCEMSGWMKHKVGIETAGRNINNLRNADDTILMAESEEELKSLLMKVKEESEKVGLKLNI